MNFSIAELSNTLEHQTQPSVTRTCDLWSKRSFSVLLGTEDEVHYLAPQCANFKPGGRVPIRPESCERFVSSSLQTVLRARHGMNTRRFRLILGAPRQVVQRLVDPALSARICWRLFTASKTPLLQSVLHLKPKQRRSSK